MDSGVCKGSRGGGGGVNCDDILSYQMRSRGWGRGEVVLILVLVEDDDDHRGHTYGVKEDGGRTWNEGHERGFFNTTLI